MTYESAALGRGRSFSKGDLLLLFKALISKDWQQHLNPKIARINHMLAYLFYFSFKSFVTMRPQITICHALFLGKICSLSHQQMRRDNGILMGENQQWTCSFLGPYESQLRHSTTTTLAVQQHVLNLVFSACVSMYVMWRLKSIKCCIFSNMCIWLENALKWAQCKLWKY